PRGELEAVAFTFTVEVGGGVIGVDGEGAAEPSVRERGELEVSAARIMRHLQRRPARGRRRARAGGALEVDEAASVGDGAVLVAGRAHRGGEVVCNGVAGVAAREEIDARPGGEDGAVARALRVPLMAVLLPHC